MKVERKKTSNKDLRGIAELASAFLNTAGSKQPQGPPVSPLPTYTECLAKRTKEMNDN